MKILSVFTHAHVVPNLYVFICSAEHKGRYLEECFNQTLTNISMGNEICLMKTLRFELRLADPFASPLSQCFPTLFLAAHQHCVYSLSPLSNTPYSTHQLIIRWV